MKYSLIITCEHSSNKIPKEYISYYKNAGNILNTHKAYDLGILEEAEQMHQKLNAPLFFADYSRLLIDLNRSLTNKMLFSDISKQFSDIEKKKIIEKYYLPYRMKIKDKINSIFKKNNKVIHISMHSFTPVLNNNIRKNDIGILYDPKRNHEKKFANIFKQTFKNTEFILRFNYPYKGISDSLIVFFRKIFSNDKYVGIEIELNQKHFAKPEFKTMTNIIIQSIIIGGEN